MKVIFLDIDGVLNSDDYIDIAKNSQGIEKLCPNSKVEKGMNIVFTEDYAENQLVTSPYEVDEWINSL